METLLCSHCFFEHVQAYRTHQLAVQASRADRDLGAVGYRLLWHPVKLVKRQFPCFVQTYLLGRRHFFTRNREKIENKNPPKVREFIGVKKNTD